MRATQQDSSIVYRIARPLLWGVLAGAVACLLILLLMAAVIAAGEISKAAVTPMAVTAAVLGAAVSGFLTARLRGQKGLLFGALAACILCLIVTLVGVSLLQRFQTGYTLIKLLLMLSAGAVGGVLGVNRRR